MHGIEHWTEFYTDYGVALQKRFFGLLPQGRGDRLESAAAVQLQVRHVDRFVERAEQEWPLARTNGRVPTCDPGERTLSGDEPATTAAPFDATGRRRHVPTRAVGRRDRDHRTARGEAVRLVVDATTPICSSILRAFAPDGEEVVFQGAIDPHTPSAQGWLRASHRELDPSCRSTPDRPYHTHDELQPLEPERNRRTRYRDLADVDRVPAGYRVALTVRGKDYEYPGPSGGRLSNFKNELRGCGPFLHDDPRDRPAAIFRRDDNAARRRAARALSCCCPSSRRRKNNRISDRVGNALVLSKATICRFGRCGGGFGRSRIFSPIRSIRATIRRCGNVDKSQAIAAFTGRTGFARGLWNDNVKVTAQG